MNKVYLGIGSNIGERLGNINKALSKISNQKSIELLRVSSIYETSPYGIKEQANFYNCVAQIETELLPEDLLKVTKQIEIKTGRKNTFRWGPRVIDIDILYFNRLKYNSENLKIPHPELLKRDFFIIPLLELNEDIIHSGTGKPLADLVPPDLPKYILDKHEFEPDI